MASAELARAWSLKTACYEAWHKEPGRTRTIADELALLAQQADPIVHALGAWTDGIALLAEGRYVDSLARLEVAQQLFDAAGDPQHAAETIPPQMVALNFLGRDADVLRVGEQALAQFLAAGDMRSAGKIEINLGTSLSRQDRHEQAEAMYRRAAVRMARQGDIELSIVADIGIANALTWQFRLDEALTMAERAGQRAREHGYRILDAQAVEAAGRIELNRGRWPQALSALARSLAILEDACAPPQRRLECEIALADAYLAVSLLDEARRLYEIALARARALQAPAELAWATLQRARLLGLAGRYSTSLEGLATARKLYGELDNVASVALADLCIARMQIALEEPRAALDSATQAARVLGDTGIRSWHLEARALQAAACAALGAPDRARSTYEAVLADAADLPQVSFECQAGLGVLLLDQGRRGEARAVLEQAVERLEAERSALPADDLRSALGGEAAAVHGSLVGLSLEQGDMRQLLDDIDRGRARALGDGIPAQRAGLQLARNDAAAGKLRALRDRWREAVAEGEAERLATLEPRILAIEQTLLEEHRRADLRAPDDSPRSGAVAAAAALDLDSLQTALGREQALVVYHMHRGELFALVVTDRSIARHTMAADGLAEHIAGLRLQLQAVRHPTAAQRHGELLHARLVAHARALGERLWAPLERSVGGRPRVVVAPHGDLHGVPFALLHDGRRWLVERHGLCVTPSPSVWLRFAAAGVAPAVRRVVAVGRRDVGLEHVAREISALQALFGASVSALYDGAATAEAVRSAVAAGADALHLACHARFRADNPAFSHLVLADGPLTMHELARWPQMAPLVVLSACETGVSRIAPGDEALGLVRACMLAGARSVVATQWAVDDATSADLMTSFYALVRAGTAPAEALRHGQMQAISRGLHPYHWAAFAVHGLG